MKQTITLVFAMTFLSAPSAFADQHSSIEITSEYVAGFIAGANLTDGAIIKNISAGNESNFIKRAYRTRLGEYHPNTQATYFAGFCIPEGVDDKTVTNKVIQQLKNTSNYSANTQRDVIVYNTIKSLYPCTD
ncbi:Rap1a/Tai family immunity protein [Amphritea sp. 1_MG-2023]|uniref:Rap1a/Tai family immunity protein n=1 Tax=Amphritea sp. 1_MG-2023 TaxID=3062670 RepID=UPI0026E3F192|nr:Rap1a/Tai family immunity protein [Amphritea sp. 1_MG-2023]MDO6562260.1 Rap1a/Tai family immunity protein [Amphritea sp. 1_MG-2023]